MPGEFHHPNSEGMPKKKLVNCCCKKMCGAKMDTTRSERFKKDDMGRARLCFMVYELPRCNYKSMAGFQYVILFCNEESSFQRF